MGLPLRRALRFDARTNTVSKCDFCYDGDRRRRDAGLRRRLPQRALDFGDLVELRKKYGDVRRIFPLPDPAQTDPALVIKPHRDAARAEERGAEVANWEEV